LGAALWGYHVLLEGTQPPTALPTAALGRTYDDNETSQALDFYVNQINTRETTVAEVASLIADGHVVAWVNTGSEMGPRALGHRSILADPRRADMRDYLNTVVKHREVFRPYAPSALAEHAHEWFDFEGSSPFMLFVPEVLAHCRDLVPSITHVDGTARLQTVDAGTDPEYHALITAFHELTGVPMVLNTSFNDNGEPIVEGPCDAVRTFLNTKIDYLVLGGHTLVTKRAHTLPDGHPSTTNAMQVA
jgi:carbamoyltransferase